MKTELFNNGIRAYNNKQFYDAHEYWEDLWNDYKLDDSLFIQGLIQLTVGYFHITNCNLKGARSMLIKCTPKLEEYRPSHRGLNIDNILKKISLSIKCIENIDTHSEFEWDTIPKLDVE